MCLMDLRGVDVLKEFEGGGMCLKNFGKGGGMCLKNFFGGGHVLEKFGAGGRGSASTRLLTGEFIWTSVSQKQELLNEALLTVTRPGKVIRKCRICTSSTSKKHESNKLNLP